MVPRPHEKPMEPIDVRVWEMDVILVFFAAAGDLSFARDQKGSKLAWEPPLFAAVFPQAPQTLQESLVFLEQAQFFLEHLLVASRPHDWQVRLKKSLVYQQFSAPILL